MVFVSCFFLDIEFMSCSDVMLCSQQSMHCVCVFQRAEIKGKKRLKVNLSSPMNIIGNISSHTGKIKKKKCNHFEGETH